MNGTLKLRDDQTQCNNRKPGSYGRSLKRLVSLRFPIMNCPECKTRPRWHKQLSHSPTCSRIDLDTAKWYAAEAEQRIANQRSHSRAFMEAAQRWEGRFRIVCHENNKLRKRLSVLANAESIHPESKPQDHE